MTPGRTIAEFFIRACMTALLVEAVTSVGFCSSLP
jgi:hypothetical protein